VNNAVAELVPIMREGPLDARRVTPASSGCWRTDIGTSSATALFTALPMAPDELSTRSSAGEMRSMNATAPSAASNGSVRATS